MMKFRKTMKYNLKNIAMISAIAGGMFAANACGDKKAIEPEKPTKEIEIKFTLRDLDQGIPLETLKSYASDKTIKTIRLIPTGHWSGCGAHAITQIRKNGLQPLLNASPKATGGGNFDFRLGEATKVPYDSLWYVKNGWAINKR